MNQTAEKSIMQPNVGMAYNDTLEVIKKFEALYHENENMRTELENQKLKTEFAKLDAQLARNTIPEYTSEISRLRNEVKRLSKKKSYRFSII